MDKTIESAWQYKDSLFVAMPSRRGGVYLARVSPTRNGLEITHSCPAAGRCWHQQAAYEVYREWLWWEPIPEKVVCKNQVVLLDPNWEQIPVPGAWPPGLKEVLDDYRKHIA